MREFDAARQWLTNVRLLPMQPLASEVWVFDETLSHVLLVQHRWRGWVPPGGRVEPREAPREAAARELKEETGLTPQLHDVPAAAAVRSYHPDWPPTLGLSYAAVVDRSVSLTTEAGQPAAWMLLAEDWVSSFPDDRERMCWHAAWLLSGA